MIHSKNKRVKKECSHRLSLLKETILKWLTEIPEKEITYEYLFYDFGLGLSM